MLALTLLTIVLATFGGIVAYDAGYAYAATRNKDTTRIFTFRNPLDDR